MAQWLLLERVEQRQKFETDNKITGDKKMKSIKKVIAAATLMMVLMVGTSFGGILVNVTENPQQSCTNTETSKGGIILSDVGGILVNVLTGILVNFSRDNSPVECGILVNSN